MIPYIKQQYLEDLKEQRQMLADAMVSGAATSFDAYTHMVGQYRGLTIAIVRMEEFIVQMQNDD